MMDDALSEQEACKVASVEMGWEREGDIRFQSLFSRMQSKALYKNGKETVGLWLPACLRSTSSVQTSPSFVVQGVHPIYDR